jgi:two-component system, OmpR family, sensor kinase
VTSPLRIRLTLVFSLAMALLLAGVGWFTYARIATDLSRALDQQLRGRAQDLSALVRHGGSLRATDGRLVERGESFAQLVTADGRVVDATPPLGRRSLLGAGELERAGAGELFANRPSVPGLDEPARILAVPVTGHVLITGVTRENRAETLSSVRDAFLIGGPIALLLAALAGYVLAGAALRPFEAGVQRERRFLADASHQLRTPLSLLTTELELALRRARSPEELREALASAAESTARLSRLADGLLVLAGAGDGRLPLKAEEVDVADLARGVASRHDIQVEAEPLVVRGDPLRLEQALTNMVDNALRWGGGDVTVTAEQRDGHVELHVLDRGSGFPPEFLAHAFERFSRAEPASPDGSGLGLAIVETIARAHGGEARAENRPGGGADVWLALPLRPVR